MSRSRQAPPCFCGRVAVGRGLCKAHHEQWRRGQDRPVATPMLWEGRIGRWFPAPASDLVSARLTADVWAHTQEAR